MRLDQLLVARGLVRSRSRARDLIQRGLVTVGGAVASKPGQEVAEDEDVAVPREEATHVSRGAEKLIAALDTFGFDPTGSTVIDVGASTGGFTEVLLTRGAVRVFAVDVGHGQLDPGLAVDPRVVALEGTDARSLTLAMTDGPVGGVVADLSFVSLKVALGPALALVEPGGWLVALVKPQFEVGRSGVGRGGIVRDAALREAAVRDIVEWLQNSGWQVTGQRPSPIAGGSGNIEILVGARRRHREAKDRHDRG